MMRLVVLLAVAIVPQQEAPDVGLFRAIVAAAAEEARFQSAWAEGRPVIVDMASFRGADRSLSDLPDAAAEAAFDRPLRAAPFSEAQDCTKPGRWSCGTVDDGLHLELISLRRAAGEVEARVRSRKYLPSSTSGLCPREIIFTFHSRGAEGWSLYRTVVDAAC